MHTPDETQLPHLIAENKSARGLPPEASFCVAPLVGIYFWSDGLAAACCYNREQAFGQYPKEPLSRIWGSDVRLRLASDLANNLLPKGCSRCTEQVLARNHGGLLAARFDPLRAHVEPAQDAGPMLPLTMEFELGTVCNLECVMCDGWVSSAIRKNREKRPPLVSPYNDTFLEQLRPFVPGLLDAKFLGGEPFLNPLNFAVCDLLIELNPEVRVHITTNGTVLTERVKHLVKTLKPELTVSMESLVPENYQRIRKGARFSVMRKNLDWLIEHGNLRSVAVCPIRLNWQDIPGIVSFCNRRSLRVFFNTVWAPEELALWSLPSAELTEIARYLSEAEIEVSEDILTPAINAGRYQGLIRQILAFREKASS